MSRGDDAGDRRRLLMVANPFPPQVSGGNARLLRFARYLPECGWDVTVLAADVPGTAPVPSDLHIVRTTAPGPEGAYRLARRLTRGSGGRLGPRSSPASAGESDVEALNNVEGPSPAAGTSGTAGSPAPAPAAGPQRRSSRRGAVNDWIAVPDEFAGWIAPAASRGRRLLRERRYHAIFSSFPKPSAELVASILARVSGLPWIADYRDPWATRHLRRYPTPLHRSVHYALEDRALRPVAAVTATNRPIADSLRHRFPALSDRVYVLPNGYDPLERPEEVPPLGPGPWIVHTGRLYGRAEQLSRVLRAFAALTSDARLLFVGIQGDELLREASGLGIRERVRTVPFVPHGRALGYQRAADALLLITGNAPEALSSKVFEYLAAGRPIFAFIPRDSAADRLLESTGGAVRAYQDDAPEDALREFVDAIRNGRLPPPDDEVVARYDGRALTRRLAGYLDCLAEQAALRMVGRAPSSAGVEAGTR